MGIESKLAERRSEMAEKWADAIFSSYPEETRRIWSKNKNRFTNPVGAVVKEVTEALIDHLIEWSDAKAIAAALEKLIKIRAVQEFTPSQSLSFAFLFKKVIREEFYGTMRKEGSLDDLLRFEAKLDNLVMMSIDIYTKCREQLFEMRVDEVKRAHKNIMRRAGLTVDVTAGMVEE